MVVLVEEEVLHEVLEEVSQADEKLQQSDRVLGLKEDETEEF
jgi:hypothetical protein